MMRIFRLALETPGRAYKLDCARPAPCALRPACALLPRCHDPALEVVLLQVVVHSAVVLLFLPYRIM